MSSYVAEFKARQNFGEGHLILENSRPASAIVCVADQAPAPSSLGNAQIVLGSSATDVVGMEVASDSGHATNCSAVAQSRLPPVLEMAFTSQAHWWPKANRQRSSCIDFSHGCGESDVGHTPHSWRIAQTCLGGACKVPGLFVIVKANGQSFALQLGPKWFIDNLSWTFNKGDKLEIIGWKQDNNEVVVRKITRAEWVLEPRDDNGAANWLWMPAPKDSGTCR